MGWIVDISHIRTSGTIYIRDQEDKVVCSISLLTDFRDQNIIDKTNLALKLAAAPELLTECLRAVETYQLMIDHFESGEPNYQSMADDLRTEISSLRLAIINATGART